MTKLEKQSCATEKSKYQDKQPFQGPLPATAYLPSVVMDDYRPKRIHIYKNGDCYFAGKRTVVNCHVYRNFEQFLLHLSDEVRLITGAVRKLYELRSGVAVHNLDNLKDGTLYVATGGEPLKRIDYLIKDKIIPINHSSQLRLGTVDKARPSELKPHRIINRSTGGLLTHDPAADLPLVEQPIFGPTSKAYKIVVFENGETFSPGKRMVLNYRNCKSFEQVLRQLSSKMVLTTGQVRKIYDAESGQRIRSLHDIYPGHNLVVASFEPFKRVPYLKQNLSALTSAVKHEAEPHPRIVSFFPNGDTYHTGLTVAISNKRFPSLARLVDTLNNQIELVTGKVQKIYSLSGVRINVMDEFETGKGYVLVANNDPFIKTRYNIMALKPQNPNVGLSGSTKCNPFMDKIRPITVHRHTRHHTNEKSVAKTVPPKNEHAISTEHVKPRTAHRSESVALCSLVEEVVADLNLEFEKQPEPRGLLSREKTFQKSQTLKDSTHDVRSQDPKNMPSEVSDKPEIKETTQKRTAATDETHIEQPTQSSKRSAEENGNAEEDEIDEDEKVKGTRENESEIYGDHNLKKLEGKSKSTHISTKILRSTETTGYEVAEKTQNSDHLQSSPYVSQTLSLHKSQPLMKSKLEIEADDSKNYIHKKESTENLGSVSKLRGSASRTSSKEMLKSQPRLSTETPNDLESPELKKNALSLANSTRSIHQQEAKLETTE
ncbi:hypothetical protein BASA61_006897 [Batrachochytrium salamandrivorans]|nr:hypothetical protein BASA61_006897 [Batrachochytrium salamandrivorans]